MHTTPGPQHAPPALRQPPVDCLVAAERQGVSVAAMRQRSLARQARDHLVPFAAGGTTDVLARALAKAQHGAGQALLWKNGRPGATIGADTGQAPADGYTLVMGGSHTIATRCTKKLSYDFKRARTLKHRGPVPTADVSAQLQPRCKDGRPDQTARQVCMDRTCGHGPAPIGRSSPPHRQPAADVQYKAGRHTRPAGAAGSRAFDTVTPAPPSREAN